MEKNRVMRGGGVWEGKGREGEGRKDQARRARGRMSSGRAQEVVCPIRLRLNINPGTWEERRGERARIGGFVSSCKAKSVQCSAAQHRAEQSRIVERKDPGVR